jgi:hypothetical protein
VVPNPPLSRLALDERLAGWQLRPASVEVWKTWSNQERAAIRGTSERKGTAKLMEASAPIHMLDGYNVLDFIQAVADPTATLMLARWERRLSRSS